jgi:hypothetical protein
MQPVLEENPAAEPESRAPDDLNRLRVRAHEHRRRCKAHRRAAEDFKIESICGLTVLQAKQRHTPSAVDGQIITTSVGQILLLEYMSLKHARSVGLHIETANQGREGATAKTQIALRRRSRDLRAKSSACFALIASGSEHTSPNNVYFLRAPHALDIRRILRTSAGYELSWSANSR